MVRLDQLGRSVPLAYRVPQASPEQPDRWAVLVSLEIGVRLGLPVSMAKLVLPAWLERPVRPDPLVQWVSPA